MGKPLEIEGCTDINNLTLDKDYTLYYTCKNSTNNSKFSLIIFNTIVKKESTLNWTSNFVFHLSL